MPYTLCIVVAYDTQGNSGDPGDLSRSIVLIFHKYRFPYR